MKKMALKISLLALATSLMACNEQAIADAEVKTPTYQADTPSYLITADTVSTKYAGELTFNDGFPTDSTIEKTNDFMDTARAFELFESGMATASMYAMLKGHRDIGMQPNKTVGITENLMDARSLWLTPNTTTPYVHIEIDVKNGPVVIEVGSPVIAIIDDAYFKYVADIGLGGADRGKGGKYLLVGKDYKGEIPEGYFVLKTNTYKHWMITRPYQMPKETLKETLKKFKSGFKVYPLAKADALEENEFINLSGKKYSTLHATDAQIYAELNEVIQYEAANTGDPEMLGLAKAIGIEKGKPFKPDARMQAILTEASSLANAAFRSVMYKPRNPDAYFYPDRTMVFTACCG